MGTISRVEKIRKYLAEHEAEIESATCGSLYVDYAGGDVTFRVGRVDRWREKPRDNYPAMD